jgi:hypothetical protein
MTSNPMTPIELYQVRGVVFKKTALGLFVMNRSTVLSVIMLILLTGCTQPPEIIAGLNENFVIKIGQMAAIPAEGLTVTLVDVADDSRCPIDVQCVWAGKTTLTIQVTKDGTDLGTENVTKLGATDSAMLAKAGYMIEISDISPVPVSNQKIEKSDYIITMRVLKATTVN